jgi:hypothetical protein
MIVLHALPFGGRLFQERKPYELENLLQQIGNYMNFRKKTPTKALSLYRDPQHTDDMQQDVTIELRR